jgi:DNA-directed RNA polymerase specialized sigma subunit
MTAKVYLEKLHSLDIKINQKLEELNALKHRSVSISVNTDTERVQTSGSGDKIGNIVSQIVDLDEEINREIDSFYERKHVVINQIQALDDANYIQVLFKKYIQFKSNKEVAQEMQFSAAYVSEVHKTALTAFESVYSNLLNPKKT